MATFQQVIYDFRATYSDCPATGSTVSAETLLNQIDEEISAFISWRQNKVYMGLTSGQFTYDLDETYERLLDVALVYPDSTWTPLYPTSKPKLTNDYPGWQGSSGVPTQFYVSSSTTTGNVGFYPCPNYSTLIVSGATNASPIVVTTSVAHGLTAGSQVIIQNVAGNTAANGVFYVTVPSVTTLGLYSDSALTVPVAGSGAYTSGGIVGTSQYPIVGLDITVKGSGLTASSNMVITPQIRTLYTNGMRKLWANIKKPAEFAMWNALFEKNLSETKEMYDRRSEQVQYEVQSFRQRANFRNA